MGVSLIFTFLSPGFQPKLTLNTDYPSYELFTESLREGVFKPRAGSATSSEWQGRQLRLVVNRNRRVEKVIHI